MNENIAKLIEAMFYLGEAPTRDEVERAMELAYRLGKNDGALETCEKFLKRLEPAA